MHFRAILSLFKAESSSRRQAGPPNPSDPSSLAPPTCLHLCSSPKVSELKAEMEALEASRAFYLPELISLKDWEACSGTAWEMELHYVFWALDTMEK